MDEESHHQASLEAATQSLLGRVGELGEGEIHTVFSIFHSNLSGDALV
jgi:hypothetical protein